MGAAPNPFAGITLAEYGRRLRAGETSAEAATRDCLVRIAAHDGRIGSLIHVAADAALVTARAVDAMRRAGADLGPLMGVPVAIKDLFFVDGMPTRAGSRVDIADLVGAVGALESALTVLTLRDGVIPPTLNYETPDPEINLDVVAGEPRYGDFRYAINNSFGFGGHNVAIAFGRY